MSIRQKTERFVARCTRQGCSRPLSPRSHACCEFHLDEITAKLEHFAGQCDPATCGLCGDGR
jgi:hypothetical protein